MKEAEKATFLDGPHRIARNGQVVIPRDVLKAARLSPGDAVYLTASDEGDGTVVLLPAHMAIQWFEAGRRSTRGGSDR